MKKTSLYMAAATLALGVAVSSPANGQSAGDVLTLDSRVKNMGNLNSIHVHQGPSINSPIIGHLFVGHDLEHNNYRLKERNITYYLGEENGWVSVKYNYGQEKGWILGEFLGIGLDLNAKYEKFERQTLYVSKGSSVLRSEPTILSRPRGGLRKGENVKIVGRQGKWYQTEFGDLVFGELLDTVQPKK